MFDVDSIRKDFPSLTQTTSDKPLVYFDSAASALKPMAMVDRIQRYYTCEASNVHRGAHFLSDRATGFYEAARKEVSDFINSPDELAVIFTSGTTDSINLVAHSLLQEFSPGDEVLISKMEHHSNIVPWQKVTQQLGLSLKFIDLHPDGRLSLESFKELLNEKTKLVSLTMVSNVTGIVNPVEDLTSLAHQKGAKVLLDAAQAMTSLDVDVQKLDCDFLAFSGHKTYGPNGIGVLFGKKQLLDEMVPFRCGGSMIRDVDVSGSTYLDAPFRFEAGTPNVGGAIGLAEALRYFSQFAIEEVHQHKVNLLELLENHLAEVDGVKLFTRGIEDRIGVCSFEVEGIHHSDISTILDQEGFAIRGGHHCAQILMKHFNTQGTLRASLDIYNSEDEVLGFVEALKKAIGFFR